MQIYNNFPLPIIIFRHEKVTVVNNQYTILQSISFLKKALQTSYPPLTHRNHNNPLGCGLTSYSDIGTLGKSNPF